MALIPVFRLGWLNAWLFMLYFPFQPLSILGIDRLFPASRILAKAGGPSQTPREQRLYQGYLVCIVVFGGLALFTPLALGSAWFYAGLALFLAGQALFGASIAAVAATPPGQPFTRGVYRFSRHPSYLSIILTQAGAALAGASWLLLLLTAVIAVLLDITVSAEERACLACFGESYRLYTQRTRRWLGWL